MEALRKPSCEAFQLLFCPILPANMPEGVQHNRVVEVAFFCFRILHTFSFRERLGLQSHTSTCFFLSHVFVMSAECDVVLHCFVEKCMKIPEKDVVLRAAHLTLGVFFRVNAEVAEVYTTFATNTFTTSCYHRSCLLDLL